MSRLAAAALVAAVATATSAGAAQASRIFETPSRNIICGAFTTPAADAFLECGVVSGLVPPPPRPSARACGELDFASNRVRLGATGRPYGFCAGDPGVLAEGSQATVLAYGSSLSDGPFRCNSARDGLTCRNRAGHGFFLSRTSWRSF